MPADETQKLLEQLQAQFAAQGQQLDNESLSSLVRQLQDRDQHDWCEAAGQSEPLTTRLKNLLKDYPADVGLFKEMVQNADDAGAARVHFIWDNRKLGRGSLLSPEMATWQTNCLWAYNDALFTEQDFEAICRLGVGGKRSSSERIGRFGLGFNSVYNLTDLPSILSDSMILFLDPHVSHLRKMGASTQKPGIKLRFLKVSILDRFRDQFMPYHKLLGCDLESSNPFKGTLIRIPFRTKESAAKSEISKIVVSDEMVAELSQQFQAEAFQWLLFLQNVQEISMSRLVADGSEPVLQTVFSVSLARAGLTKRPSIVTCGSSGRGTAVSTQLEVLCSEKQMLRKYHLFTDTQHGFRSRVCLAVPLMQEQDAADVWCHDEDGRVFCFLPVPRNIDLGLRLHVHAPLNMAQDRRSVLLDNRIGESEQELVRHNFYLLDDLIPSALMACLQDLAVKRNQMPPAHFFALFPTLSQGSLAPSQRIAQTFYAKLLAQGAAGGGGACPLPIAAPASLRNRSRSEAPPQYWVKIAEAVFVPSVASVRAEHVTQALLDSVVECLLRCGVPLVDAPPNVLESLMRSGQGKEEGGSCGKNRSANFTILTPSWLRQRLRSEGGMKPHAINHAPAANIFAQLTPVDVTDLLEFAVSDGNIDDLSGVPLLMCEDEATVQPFLSFSQSAQPLQPVFFPQNPLERRLFPNKDGKKLLLASKFEARPMLWAKFKKLAEQVEQAEQAEAETENEKESRAKAAKASPTIPAFQCKYVTFPRLVRALQMLLPRTWNKPVPSISMNDYAEWVEDWLQAMWKWLGDKEVNLFNMVHWPLIPSLSGAGVDLVRIPEANKLVLFSGRRAQEASVPMPSASGYPPPAVQPTQPTEPPQPPQPLHPNASRPPPPPSRPGTNRNEPVKNPANGSSGSSGSQGKEKFLRVQKLLETHLHCRPIFEPSWLLQHENQLRTCVHASTAEGLLKSMHFASKLISSCQKSPITPAQALHVSLSKALSPHDVGALLSIAATVQKEGCSCEKVDSRASWKSHCEVLRGLPFLCRFNKPQQHISLAGTENAEEFWILPETCPEVLGALRAAQVDLPTVEVADEVLETVTSETWAVSSLLREHLGLPKFQWSDLLLKHVFPWAHTSSGEVRQSLMRAIVYHWRDMELTGHSACLEALQQIPFISTVGGGMLSAAEALDPAIERLPALYGPGDIRGPFPDSRWQSAECRAVLQFRSHLNYQELNERLGFLHHLEVQRRESNPQQESQIPGDVLIVSNALLRYVCEVVSPLMVDSLQSDQEEKQDFDSRSLWGMLSLTGIGMEKPKSEAKASSLAEEELMSIQSKLRRCFWLPPLSAPSGWPAEAPWKGSLCGLCSAEEVRLVSEEFLVGMVRPLIGLPVRGAGNTVRLPKRFLESIGLQEKPQEDLLKEQLCKMEEWTMSLPAAKREVHASWITRCLYDHLYPMLVHSASIQEFVSDKTKRLWVSQGGFLPLSRMSRQSIEFPPYLVKAPAEWKEKNPLLWSNIKDNFGVADYSEALQCISKAEETSPQLDAPSLDIAVRLVMAITDNLQQERAENSGAAAAAGSKLDILMPTSENTLRPARDCVFNNMTWLPDVETADLNLGTYCLVHPKISHAVAHTCGCRGLSLVYAREATEMHGADWCEAAGQSEPITTRLKNLLKDYPADISMFKEMVQNADDAGATEVHFVWDWRQHRKQSLLTPDMDRWQGPSLWIFNNAQFTTKDFDSICRLGVGGKREQQRKIGRFGLGFNSVYNFTDLPSILSGDMVLFLDPHVHHLSAMGASVQKPGIKLRFLKINVLEKFRDQFEPYHGMLGCDLSSSHPFEGTLIRVPFRTPEVAKASEVSSIQLDAAAADVLSSRFQKEAFQWLLFLQSVAKIRLSEIREGDSKIQCLCEVNLMPQSIPTALKDGTSKEEKGKRGKGGQGGKGGEGAEPMESMALELQAPRPRVSAIGSDSVADVSISTESFGSPPYQRCLSYRLVGGEDCGVSEQVCAALPLVELPASTKHPVKLRKEEGRLFCFLPLPPSAVSLRVAMHVHAPLNTTQDRRNVLLDNRVGDNEIISTNVRLLDVRIPECLARCAINLSNLATPEDFFSIFPVLQRSMGAATGQKTERKDAHPEVGVADRVAHSFYKLLIRRPEPIFPTAAGSMKKCVPFRDAVFCSEREAKLSSGGPPEQANALLEKVIASLARFGVPIVKIPLPVLESFEQVLHPVLPRTLTPAWLRQFLRNISASSIPSATPKRGFDLQDSSDDSAQKSGEGITIGSLTPEEAVAFLDFVLADNGFGDLEGVPLLFTEDMTAGTQPFTLSGTSMLFVPEDEEEYQLLPQAPRRLLSKRIRNSRPWVWQNLQRMASSEVQPSQPTQGEGPSFQLRKMTVSPLMSALQELLPKAWNVPVPEVGKSDWEGWAETWLRALWNWLSRMSVPARNMMHWPILPSLQEKSETDKTRVTNASTEVEEPAATQVVARLHRLVPDSTIFSIQKEPEETKSSGLLEGRFGKPLVGLMQKVGCTPVWLPDWLQERESQLHGFVHPGTADGLMKACHNRLRTLALQGEKEGHLSAVLKFRNLFGSLTAEQHSALAAWLVMAGPENCDCHSANGGQDPAAWRLKCEIFRTAPLFSPFARQEQVAMVDFDSQAPKGSIGSWSLLPEACPEVAAALRAAGIPMPGCVEPVDAENVAALVRELHMPRLTWAEVLLGHVFPWASKPEVEPTARQGLMLAIVQRWRQMELAGNEQCVEALQLVSFIPTVDGQMRSPATLLDPRKEDLKLLYMGDGPFPAAEVNAVLLPLMQRGLLRCRQELSLKELHERLVFLDSKHQLAANSPEEGEWDKVKSCAENFLQYAATTVSTKCQEVRTAAAAAAAAAVPEAPSTSPSASAAKKEKAHSFFSWSSIMPLGDFLTGATGSSLPEKVESLEKREEWAEDDVETLKCKFRSCRWIPAAKAPREWLAAIPWAGSAHKLWRPSELVLMSDFWTCGAASPVLDLETQVVLSGERKPNLHSDFLELLGISSLPEIQRIHCAWAQLETIRSWSQKHPDGKANESESAWISKCLYHYVYPLITGEAKANEMVSGKSNGCQQLDEIFVAGTFVPIEDLSLSQDFGIAGLHQIPKELQTTARKLCSQIRPKFQANDLARALYRLSQKNAGPVPNGNPNGDQLSPGETESAVHLAMALSERIRSQGEDLPEHVMVPTSQGKLRPAEECVFNNMRWLSEEEQHKRNRAVTSSGLHWVHQSISNDVAVSLNVQALSTQVAAEALAAADDGEKDPEWFEAAGQTEPLTTRLRSLLRDISESEDLGLFKSLLQNADDAKASEVHFVWDWRSFGRQSLMSPEMGRWQGPCLWAHNNASFSPQDFENITQLGAVKSTSRKAQIGRFGLGFNSVYSLTDLPSILSDDVVLFLDPHVHHLKAMGASPAKPGIKLRFLKIDVLDKFRDQFEPYHGMFGCDLKSSTRYQGTLIRMPFRTPEAAKASEISKTLVSQESAMAFLRAFRDAAAECLVFLQHVQRIVFSWIPSDAGANGTPQTFMEIKITPPGIPLSLDAPKCSNSSSSSKQAGESVALSVEISTDEQALEYRRLFSSRTVAQSKEKQSFISDMLNRLGMSKSHPDVRPYISFNLVVSISWSPPMELQKEFDSEPYNRKEAWRLILQHDNPEDERWAGSRNEPETSEAAEASFVHVPFGGLALCLSRPLRTEEPRICCFMPLPITSSLPFLINANFCLSDPTAPGRLDLVRPGSTSNSKSDWNGLILRNIIEPLICTLIHEQSAALQAFRCQKSANVAVWADREGVCSLMPRKSQLPLSLQQLLNLPTIYASLSHSALFPVLSFETGSAGQTEFGKYTGHTQFAEFLDASGLRTAAPLVSYVDSVQPLPDDIGTVDQRQAVHEYLCHFCQPKEGKYRFCDVVPEVQQEFSSAGLKRKAYVDRSLVLSCLRQDSHHKYSCATASKLLGFILSGEQDDSASKLQGLKLAPLCDNKVACFGDGSDQPLFCAFVSDNSRSSFAQRVLQQLASKATLDLSGLDARSHERLRRQADKLGIRHVEKCEQLSEALLLALPSIRASAPSSSVLASLDETFAGRILGSTRQAAAGSLGFGSDEHASSTLCALWSFVQLAEDGLSDEFLSAFDGFYVVPAWNAARSGTQNSASSIDAPLMLVPLSASEPLLLPECEQNLEPLMEVAAILVSDRFVDKSHPAMTDSVLRFLQQKGIVQAFSRGSLLTVLAASAEAQLSSLISRCQRLQPDQRELLRSQLCQALCDPIGSLEDGRQQQVRASVVCKLPIFLAESWSDGSNLQAFRSLMQLAVVDGEPLPLKSPPVRLDLDTAFVFRVSTKTHAEVSDALGLVEVKEILAEQGKYFDMKTWLQKQILPHLESMIPDDQVIVLERLLPLLQDVEEANSEPYLVPAETHGKMMKPPFLILDPQDFTIQEIFGFHGEEDWPALDGHQRYHFPAKSLSAPVLSHLRRLGMRKSVGDGDCLAYLCQVLKDQHNRLPWKRYQDLQRGLMQRIVESWRVLPAGPHRDAILQKAFVDTSRDADSTDLSDTLFELKPFTPPNELFKLSELVSRAHPLDPYLCWTTLPLCPRGFPEFEGYQRPTLKDVVAHALALGSLPDGAVPVHQWEEFKEKVVGPMCQFLAQSEVFQEATAPRSQTEGAPAQMARECAQVCSRLRKAKFIAIPLDPGSGGTGPHTLVAPWRISLVLKEHRPPMFALPDYLTEHVSVLRMLGVRDAVELPQESLVGQETDNARAADEAMTWLFENGSESFSDVTVRCDGGNLFLHRNILMSRSEYFKAMFQGAGSGFLESHSSGAEVSLMEFPLEVTQILFGYLYHGRVDERPLEGADATSNSLDLMCLADQLGVPRLFEFAQLWVANQQDLEDCSEMLKLASRHRADLLERATLSLMAANVDSPEVEHQLPNLAEDQRQKLEELIRKHRTN